MSPTRQPECGIGPCKPRFMRRFASVNWFTVGYCASSLLTSSLSVYIVSQVTAIERQFGLSSTKSGYLMACNDIGYSLTILLMSYFANRVHIPRFLCFSTILYGLSGILCSIPHFIAPKTDLPSSSVAVNFSFSASQLCKDENQFNVLQTLHNFTAVDSIQNQEADRVRQTAMALIAIGMILQGIGKAPRFPMLAQFMDDNTGPRETGYYMGIITSIGIFGPAIAYGLGGLFSRIYVTLEDVDIHPRDPRWIGAWWLGFVCFGIGAIVVAIPLLFFPARLKPPTEKPGIIARRRKMKVTCGSVCREITGVFKSIIKVIKTPIFSLVLVATLCNVMGFGATMSFGPKYMQTQFNIPAWHANIILAAVGIASVSIGSFLGGYLTKRLHLNPPRTLMLLLAVQFPSLTLNFVAMFLHCDQPVIHNWPSENQYPTPICNQDCFCGSDKYFPICGSDGRNYFSPCHAGCTMGSLQSYQNCACIAGGNATAGLCKFDCGSLWPFNVVSFISSLMSSCTMMPTFIMFLRIVSADVKSMAIGVSALCMSLFAWLPGPVIGGILVDNACLLWSGNADLKGYCSFYHLHTLRFNLFGYVIGFRTLGTLLLLGALRLCWYMKEWPGNVEPDSDDVSDQINLELPIKTGKKPNGIPIPESDLLMKKINL